MLETSKRKELLRMMLKVRAFEEKLNELYQKKAMFGNPHSYRGREAVRQMRFVEAVSTRGPIPSSAKKSKKFIGIEKPLGRLRPSKHPAVAFCYLGPRGMALARFFLTQPPDAKECLVSI